MAVKVSLERSASMLSTPTVTSAGFMLRAPLPTFNTMRPNCGYDAFTLPTLSQAARTHANAALNGIETVMASTCVVVRVSATDGSLPRVVCCGSPSARITPHSPSVPCRLGRRGADAARSREWQGGRVRGLQDCVPLRHVALGGKVGRARSLRSSARACSRHADTIT